MNDHQQQNSAGTSDDTKPTLISPELHNKKPRSPTSATTAQGDDSQRIRRPSNAWLLFRTDQVKQMRAAAPPSARQPPQGELSKTIAAMWRTCPPEVKKEYEERAEEEKRQHKIKWPGYRYQPTKATPRAAGGSARGERGVGAKASEHAGSSSSSSAGQHFDRRKSGSPSSGGVRLEQHHSDPAHRGFAGFRQERAPGSSATYALPPSESSRHQPHPTLSYPPHHHDPLRGYPYPGQAAPGFEFTPVGSQHWNASQQHAQSGSAYSAASPYYASLTAQSSLPPLGYGHQYEGGYHHHSASHSHARPIAPQGGQHSQRWDLPHSAEAQYGSQGSAYERGQPSGVASDLTNSPEEGWHSRGGGGGSAE